jgi:hypothetical protein
MFFLGLLLRRQEIVHGETEFLGFEAFTRPTDTSGTSPVDKAGARASSSSGQELPKAA